MLNANDSHLLVSASQAEKEIVNLGIPKPQRRVINLFFKESGSYPGFFYRRYSEEMTKKIFEECNLSQLAKDYYERLKDFGRNAAEEIWRTAINEIDKFLRKANLIHVQAS
jgi:hypothetical protein